MQLSYQVHSLLKSIIEKSYPDKDIKGFFVEVHPKEMKGRHGDYNPRERKIRIFNLSQPTQYTVATAIHELAHHCEFCLYGNTGHSKQFYGVFKQLLETSIQMGIIDYEAARTQSNASDIATLEKYFGKIEASYNPEMDEKKDRFTIRVRDSFPIKSVLSSNGYKYEGAQQTWNKEVDSVQVDKEKEFLKSLNHLNYDVIPANQLEIIAIYYVVVKGGFEQRESLSNNGYYFNGYKYKGNVWVKKIISTDLSQEKVFLSQFKGIQYKVDGIKNMVAKKKK